MFDEERLKQFKNKYINSNSDLLITPFGKGLNSNLFKLIRKSEKDNLLLKFYRKRSQDDQRDRCQTEVNVLAYLNSLKLCNVPRIVDYNGLEGWTLMTEIKGKKIKKINNEHIQDIINFIVKSNSVPAEKNELISNASDPLLNISSYMHSIHKRCTDLSNLIENQELEKSMTKIVDELRYNIEEEIDAGLNRVCPDQSHLYCFSQSDVGIHNVLSTRKGLSFIDFEYAGIDHISKLLADWIVHPESPMQNIQEQILINGILKSKMFHDTTWVELTEKIKPITSLKWCLLIIKKGILSNDLTKSLELFYSYYRSVTSPLIKRN